MYQKISNELQSKPGVLLALVVLAALTILAIFWAPGSESRQNASELTSQTELSKR